MNILPVQLVILRWSWFAQKTVFPNICIVLAGTPEREKGLGENVCWRAPTKFLRRASQISWIYSATAGFVIKAPWQLTVRKRSEKEAQTLLSVSYTTHYSLRPDSTTAKFFAQNFICEIRMAALGWFYWISPLCSLSQWVELNSTHWRSEIFSREAWFLFAAHALIDFAWNVFTFR